MEKGLKRYPNQIPTRMVMTEKPVPIQKNPESWDRAYAQIKVRPEVKEKLWEGTDGDRDLLKQQLAIGLGLQLIEAYGIEETVDETDGHYIYTVVAPFGPYEMKHHNYKQGGF